MSLKSASASMGLRGRPFRDNRRVVEGIVYRYRAGIAWRDVPTEFGPWQTIWKRHRRYAGDGTWDKILTGLLTHADSHGLVDWTVSVDSTICRAHQHGTNLTRDTGDLSNHTNLRTEPDDHALGRSRGGLSTKIHQLSDGKGRPLVLLIGPGQEGDSSAFPLLMKELSVPRIGPGRSRPRPDAVLGDNAHSSKAKPSSSAITAHRGSDRRTGQPEM